MTFDYIISFHEYQRSQNSTQIDTSVIALQYKMYTWTSSIFMLIFIDKYKNSFINLKLALLKKSSYVLN